MVQVDSWQKAIGKIFFLTRELRRFRTNGRKEGGIMLSQIITYLKAGLGKNEEGQTLVEYVLIIVLVALAILVANPSLTSAILSVFQTTSTLLDAHTPA